MARSFALGLRRSEQDEFYCWNPSLEKAKNLASELGGVVVQAELPKVDVVILGFKPQKLSTASSELEAALKEQNPIILSLLAAVETAALKPAFPHKKILRVMPNLPVKDGAGVVLWHKGELSVSESGYWQKRFDAMGLSAEMSEKDIDLYTLHAGCSPAFLYAWIDAAADFAVKNGGDSELAKRILIQAWSGTVQGLAQGTLDMQARIEAVASKGGVTRAALDGFALNPTYIQDGFAAGLKRIAELKGH